MSAKNRIIPIFLPHWGCPYHCIYCDQRVISNQYEPVQVYRQVAEALQKIPPGQHPVEVAFYGGTFTALPYGIQQELLLAVAPFVAAGAIDSLRVSTHPACISSEVLDLLKSQRVKTVELGVQSMDSQVLGLSGRNYNSEVVEEAAQLLKEKGFRLGIQLMPGLPGDNKPKTLSTVRRVINLYPDFVRVYPTIVLAGTALADLWRQGKYQALDLDQAVDWCIAISKLFTGAGIPIIRMGLHPSKELEAKVLAGPYHPAFKSLVDSALMLETIAAQLTSRGSKLAIYCHVNDIPVVRGHGNRNIRELQQKYGFREIKVLPDAKLPLGKPRVMVPELLT